VNSLKLLGTDGGGRMNRDAAARNIQAAIVRRKDKFVLTDVHPTIDGYRATFCQGPLSVRVTIDEGTAEDVAPAGEPATKALAAVLDEVHRQFGGP